MQLQVETQIYKKDAIKDGIADAKAEVTKYITYTDENVGIQVHNKTRINKDFIQINATDISMWRNGKRKMSLDDTYLIFYDGNGTADTNKLAQYGSTIQIFKPTTGTAAVTIDQSGATFNGAIVASSLSTGTKTTATTGNGFYVDTNGNIYVGNGSTNNFKVTAAGEITAVSGKVGGWSLGSTFLSTSTSGTPGSGVVTLSKGIAGKTTADGVLPASQTWAFTAGNQFGVTTAGKLYATDAVISGTMTIGSGSTIDTNATVGGTSMSTIISNASNGASAYSNSIKSTVSCYYRKENTAPTQPTSSTSIGTSATTSDAWEYVMPQPKRNCTFYTCEEYTPVTGNKTYSTMRELSSETYASKWVSSSDNTYIDGGRLYANSVTADQITVNNLSALSANMGELTSGTIKYGTVGSNDSFYLSNADTSAKIGGQTSAVSGLRLTVGSDFGVTSAGKLYATGADISGTIYASAGTIGNFTLSGGKLYSGSHSTYNAANSGVYIGSDYVAGGSGAVWYFKNDGSAKIGAITISNTGAITVPADTFSISSVSGLQTSLNGKAASGAENTAKSYLDYNQTNGLRIAQSSPSSATTNMVQIKANDIRVYGNSTNGYTKITSSGMEVFANIDSTATSIASFGTSARIGKNTAPHVNIEPTSISMSDGARNVYEVVSNDGGLVTITKGYNFTMTTAMDMIDNGIDDDINIGRTVSTWSSIVLTYSLYNKTTGALIGNYSSPTYTTPDISPASGKFSLNTWFDTTTNIFHAYIYAGDTLGSDEELFIKKLTLKFNTTQRTVESTLGAFADKTSTGILRVGNGTADSTAGRSNGMLVDYSGNAMFGGHVYTGCGPDSSGGICLSKVVDFTDAKVVDTTNYGMNISYYQIGYLVQLEINCWRSQSVASGSNIFSVTLADAHIPTPLVWNVMGASYYGAHAIGVRMFWDTDGWKLHVRNASNSAVTASNDVTISLCYIWAGVSYTDEVAGEDD